MSRHVDVDKSDALNSSLVFILEESVHSIKRLLFHFFPLCMFFRFYENTNYSLLRKEDSVAHTDKYQMLPYISLTR